MSQSIQPISILFNAAALLNPVTTPRLVSLEVLEVTGKIDEPLRMVENFLIDATMHEEHTSENEITDHPVEIGKNITDHIRVKPRTLTIEGLITDSPSPAPLSAVFSSASASLPNVVDSSSQAAGVVRSQAAYERLVQLASPSPSTGLPPTFDIVTPLHRWTNMAFLRLQITREPKTGQALSFHATFKEIILVSSQITLAPLPLESTVMGEKDKAEASGSTKLQATSVLYNTAVTVSKATGFTLPAPTIITRPGLMPALPTP